MDWENAAGVIGLPIAVVFIPIIVAHLKPVLRAIPYIGASMFSGADAPWPLVADVVAILWVYLLRESGQAPGWIDSGASVLLAGMALGLASGAARDAVTGALRQAPSSDSTSLAQTWREPGDVTPT